MILRVIKSIALSSKVLLLDCQVMLIAKLDEEFFKFRLDKLISCLNKKDLDEALILAKELVPEWVRSEN